MELSGSLYLYTLAPLGMIFTTTVAILIVLRQSTGATLTRVQIYAVEVYIGRGFLVAGFSVLPMLIEVFGLGHAAVWRICSIVLFAVLLPYWFTAPRRRRQLVKRPAPPAIKLFWAADWVLTLWVLANAIGYPLAPGPGPYLATLTFFLAQTCFLFMVRLLDDLELDLSQP